MSAFNGPGGIFILFSSTRRDWFGHAGGDMLAGLVVALALIPEAIAFSIIAGVDPKVGLYASFCIAVITAIVDRFGLHDKPEEIDKILGAH